MTYESNHIEDAKEKHYSHLKLFRHKGKSIQDLYDDPLMEFKPPFIDVTTSREEFIYG
jgi:methylenetetrahydrofolate reductase (NADPH)